jgi:phosphomannomutase
VRASNTTPVLVLRFEGQTQAALDRIQEAMLALLRSVKPDAHIEQAAH